MRSFGHYFAIKSARARVCRAVRLCLCDAMPGSRLVGRIWLIFFSLPDTINVESVVTRLADCSLASSSPH